MKKFTLLFSFILLFIAFYSCEQQIEMNSLESIDASITIDKDNQIILEPTTSTKEEIENNSCGETSVTTLFAGQHIDVGTVTVSNDEINLFITYNVIGNWWLTETHLYVGSEENLPLNGGGNPIIGHFPYHGDHGQTQNYTFTIPLDNLESCFVIASHAVVVKKENGKVTSSETAFGFGENTFSGSRWGWYSNTCKQECDDNNDDSDDNDDDDDGNDDDDNNDDNNDDNDDNYDDNSDDNIGEDNCLNTFAYNTSSTDRSYCFTYTDSDQNINAGWSNEFNFYVQQDNHYILPLYAKVDNCNINPTTNANTLEVGYVDIYLFSEGVGDGMELFTTIKYVITNTAYELSDADLYLSNVKNPTDLDPVNGYYNYNVTSDYWNSSQNTFEKLPWPGFYNSWDTYFIPNATVCKVN